MNRSRTTETPKTSHLSPLRISLIYFVVGALWIVLTGFLLHRTAPSGESILAAEVAKGLFYVTTTSLLLYALCRHWLGQIRGGYQTLEATRARYETYLENSPVAIAVFDLEGNLKHANQATLQLTGYSAEEAHQLTIYDLDAVGDRAVTDRSLREVLAGGHGTYDRYLKRKEGSDRWIRVSALRVGSELLCFSLDITDRKRSEEKLAVLNNTLGTIRDVNQTIVKEKDLHRLLATVCRILSANPDFSHASVVLLQPDDDVEASAHAPETDGADALEDFLCAGRLVECFSDSQREDGCIVTLDPQPRCPHFPSLAGLDEKALLGYVMEVDGSTGYLVILVEPATARNEEAVGLFKELAEDLQFAIQSIYAERERSRATKALKQAKEAAEAANHAKDDFLAVMSHEMRTPLNPIMGHASLLLEDTQEPERRASLEQISQSGERMLGLIDDILYFTRLRENASVAESDAVDPGLLCREAVDSVAERYPENTLRLRSGADDADPLDVGETFWMNADALTRLLNELLTNACKYSPQGTVTLEMGKGPLVGARRQLRFSVRDDGIGIPEAQRHTLFEPFTQRDASMTRQGEGVGLGLAICRKIADRMSGSIDVSSQPGKGSIFSFKCLLRPVAAAEASRSEETPDSPASPPAPGRLPVLIVEDNRSNAAMVRAILRRYEIRSTIAKNGLEAVECCGAERYGLILMDLSMPVMNGFDATTQIREGSSLNAATPIVGISAHASPTIKEKALKGGMVAFLTKPIRSQDLIETVNHYRVDQPS